LYRVIYIFFFLSGFSSLVFEILWESMLTQVFGTSSFALSTLLTAFMSGMAIGSYLAGRIADRLGRPLRVYGLLEAGIGLYAFMVPAMLDLLPFVYDAMFDHFLNDFYLFSLLRFLAVFFILILPTTMMGATLPIVSQWISQRKDLFQGSIGLLYGVNTIGACAGTCLAGFVLLPTFGLSTTNITFGCVNLVLGAIIVVSDFLITPVPDEDADPDDVADPEGATDAQASGDPDHGAIDDDLADELGRATGYTRQSDPLPTWLVNAALAAFAISGAISMAYQVLWTRAYVIVLGSSTYSFTIILTAFLIGIGGGSALMSSFVERIKRPVLWLAVAQLGVAVTALLAYFFLDTFPEWLYHRFRQEIRTVFQVYLYYFFMCGVVILLPTILQGMSFPLVIRAVVRDRNRTGEDVGRAYAFNTAGSIVGSFMAGFVLMVFFGLHLSITIVIAVNFLLAAALGASELIDQFSSRKLTILASVFALGTGAFVLAPAIDRTDLTRGMFRTAWARNFSEETFYEDDPELLYYEDGVAATVSVEKRGDLHTLKANAKPEASDGDDMSTQILVGLMPYIVRSGWDDVEVGGEHSAMVGYGSGVTAGSALRWPLEELEVIEIESAMFEAGKYFRHVNHSPLKDDRMQPVESDGRNYLEYTNQTYDVIVSEPSNPWIAGVASLFTVDNFKAIKSHLADDGVFAQWVQLYEMRPNNVRRIFNTVLEVFPQVHAFTSYPRGSDVILIAAKQPLPFPAEGWQRAWEMPKVREELQQAGIDHIHDLYGLAFMNDERLREFAEGARLNTDDNQLLEYEAPKDLIRYQEAANFFTDDHFAEDIYGDLRPYLEDWPDSDTWSDELVGTLVRATWRGAKPELARRLLRDTGHGTFDPTYDTIVPPLDPLESTQLVLHAQSRDLQDTLIDHWPNEGSAQHQTLINAIEDDQRTQAMRYLESDEDPGRHGYLGERGLLYAYLLYHDEYYRFAGRQLEHLADNGSPEITDSLPFYLLRGRVAWTLEHWDDAWRAYLNAGSQIAF